MIDLESQTLSEELCSLILSGRCVAFIGSGLSACSYWSWPELVNELCAACGSPLSVTRDSTSRDLLRAAQDAKERCVAQYLHVLGAHFGKPVEAANLLYDSLLALPFQCYLTTNYDPTLKLKGQALPVHFYPNLDRRHTSQKSIHYLHGLINEGECPALGPIVLAESEFATAYADNTNLMQFLGPTFENDPLVFIGCRLDEPVMTKVFEICKRNQLRRTAIALERDNRPPPVPKRFILKRIPVVQHRNGGTNDDATYNRMHEEVEKYRHFDVDIAWYHGLEDDHTQLRNAFDALARLDTGRPTFQTDESHDVI